MSQHGIVRFQAPTLPGLREVAPYFAESEKARWFSNGGPCVSRFERACADYLGLEHSGVAVSSATAGLMIAIRACMGTATNSRRLVAVPSFTFIASVNVIAWSGFTPVFVDIDPNDWHVSSTSLAQLEALGSELAGILLCSTFGTAPSAARRTELESTARALGVPIVVDSAAGFGSVDSDGVTLGRQGDAEVFSFHATKPFAIGEGGLVTATSPDLLHTITQLNNFGFDQTRSVPGDLGINGKMPELSAAVGLAVLEEFDSILHARRNAAAWLRSELADRGIRFQAGSETSAFQFVPIAMPDAASRDRLLRNAQSARVEVRAYFDPPMHHMPVLADCQRTDALNVTDRLAERIIALPMANDITSQSLERIRDLVISAL